MGEPATGSSADSRFDFKYVQISINLHGGVPGMIICNGTANLILLLEMEDRNFGLSIGDRSRIQTMRNYGFYRPN